MKTSPLTAAAALALLFSVLATNTAGAQSTPSLSGTAQTANGVIMQAIQPAAQTTSEKTTTSLLWIYDTNTRQLMLCSSRTNGGFDCSHAVPLNWQPR